MGISFSRQEGKRLQEWDSRWGWTREWMRVRGRSERRRRRWWWWWWWLCILFPSFLLDSCFFFTQEFILQTMTGLKWLQGFHAFPKIFSFPTFLLFIVYFIPSLSHSSISILMTPQKLSSSYVCVYFFLKWGENRERRKGREGNLGKEKLHERSHEPCKSNQKRKLMYRAINVCVCLWCNKRCIVFIVERDTNQIIMWVWWWSDSLNKEC